MPDTPRPRPTIADLLAAHGPQPARYERDTRLPRPDPRPGQVAIPEAAYVPLDDLTPDAEAFATLSEALRERDRAVLAAFLQWEHDATFVQQYTRTSDEAWIGLFFHDTGWARDPREDADAAGDAE